MRPLRLRVAGPALPSGARLLVVDPGEAAAAGLRSYDRVRVRLGGRSAAALLAAVGGIVGPGEAAASLELAEALGLRGGEEVEVTLAGVPPSYGAIRRKMRGESLSPDEIRSVVEDVAGYSLGELEVAAFLLAQEMRGMTPEEVRALTAAMVEVGGRIDFGRPVYEKHSIGGVPGNKVSLLVVPIVASAGVFIPKTSSRAITSPSGTADTMEVLAPVEFSPEEFREVALRAGGAIVWNGGLRLSPVSEVFARVGRRLEIDPPSQMMASILSEKLAVGTHGMVLDIPVGRGAKVETLAEAESLASRFLELGRAFGVRIQCAVTYGGQPVGHAVGPALEAREALEALSGRGPASLTEKSTGLAGMLLELAGAAPRGGGKAAAEAALESGRAERKLREIVDAQGGDPSVGPEDVPVGEKSTEVRSTADGYVTRVYNSAVAAVARAAGAPEEKGAGVLLHAKQGYKVRRGDVLFEIYAERESRLTEALALASELRPVMVEGMLLRRIPDYA